MKKADRLFEIMKTLRRGGIHRAEDLAQQLHVSPRTIYRDIETLAKSGFPIKGTQGTGYCCTDHITLPPLTLAQDEFEILNLALSIITQGSDPVFADAAQRLSKKIAPALHQLSIDAKDQWKLDRSPFGDPLRGFSFMPLIRSAIAAKQKLQLSYHSKGDRITSRIIRPLKLEHWGRIWVLGGWCETRNDFREFRVDLIQSLEALPQMFVDETGKTLQDW